MFVEDRQDALLISTDPARLDVRAIHAYLTRSYWASGIPLETVERCIQGAICFGVYDEGRQIGFARVITDRATFAYLADVYILESHQGRGLGKWLMRVIMAHPDLQRLRRFSLATRDAHGLYAQFGFTPLRAPDRHMEIARPNIYSGGGA
ncbi:MAG: GNAT family N-acetyltransferase [Acidobacteriota bacterium]